MKIGRLLLRVTVGGFFFGHGTQKLFGWFGGHGLDATASMFHQMGMRPGRRNAVAAGVAEAGGGAALALGFATPLAAGALTSVMLTAINRVHLKNGPWVASGGYEYNVVLIAAALALAEVGPGELSLDHALGTERSGPRAAVAAAAIGVVGAVGAHQVAQAYPEPPAPAEAPAAASAEAPAATPAEAPAATPAEALAATRAETPAQTTAASSDDGGPAAPAGSPSMAPAPGQSAPGQSAPSESAPSESAPSETPGS